MNNITKTLIKTILLLLFVFSQTIVNAQTPAQIKRSADKLFKVFAYKNALADYKKIEASYVNNINLKYQMGVCFFHLNRLEECIKYLDFYTKNSTTFKVKTNYYLARSYHLQHKFRAAALYYKRHLKSLTKKDPERIKFKNLILQCTNGPKIEQINSNAIVSSLGEQINTPYDEYRLCFNPKFPNMLYFSSNREIIDTSSAENFTFNQIDIFKSELLFGNWSNIKPLSGRYNSKSNEELVCFFDYGYQMLFLKELPDGQKEIVKDNFNTNSENIILPFALSASSNHWDGDHFFAADSILIFSSDRSGGYGGKDLYFSVLSKGNTWSKAINLGPKINGINDEISPFLARDGRTLYFSSNNTSGMGGFDIYKAFFKDSTKKWSQRKNLGTPLNSAADDKNFIIANDAFKAYFDSDRIQGKGGFDIYSAYFRDFIPEHLLSQQNNTFIEVLLDTNNLLAKNNRPRKNRYPRKTYNSSKTKTIYNFTPIYYNAQTGESEGSRNTIILLSKLLSTHEDAIVVLSGHSDNSGIPFNDRFLSIKQAEQVAKQLIKNGAKNKQIWLHGYGQNYPVANSLNFDNSPNQLSKKINRRINVDVFNIAHLNDVMKVNYINPKISDVLQNDAYDSYKNKLKGLSYKVQITETPNLYNHSAFDELSHPSTEKQPNDINIKYLAGLEKSFINIKKVFDKAKAIGLSNAKIIPYINGLRIDENEIHNKVKEFNDLRYFLDWKAK